METATQQSSGAVAWGQLGANSGGRCNAEDGSACSSAVQSACDTMRAYPWGGHTGNETPEEMCFEVERWVHTGRGNDTRRVSYAPFYEACRVLEARGMRITQHHGVL